MSNQVEEDTESVDKKESKNTDNTKESSNLSIPEVKID